VALALGLVIALLAVFLVLEPVIRPAGAASAQSADEDEVDPAHARRDLALAALKEIDFDKETGKLSDDDYERLRGKYTTEALDALRDAELVAPSPAAAAETGTGNGKGAAASDDAVEALIASARKSSKAKGRKFCVECGSVMEGSGRFCVECGAKNEGLGIRG